MLDHFSAFGRAISKKQDGICRKLILIAHRIDHLRLCFFKNVKGRVEEAMKEADLAMMLRPNDANVAYNAACVYCSLGKKPEAMAALRKAKGVGWKDTVWTRRDPDLSTLHGDPEFDKLFPPGEGGD